MVTEIRFRDALLAILVSHDYREPGVNFFTPADLSQQVARIAHPAGREIAPHFHIVRERHVRNMLETLVVLKGKIRVDLYSGSQEYLESRVLNAGDTLILISGGHGFEVLEDAEMIEVKQGPYLDENDTCRFMKAVPHPVQIK